MLITKHCVADTKEKNTMCLFVMVLSIERACREAESYSKLLIFGKKTLMN
jgi:hypothetical protein